MLQDDTAECGSGIVFCDCQEREEQPMEPQAFSCREMRHGILHDLQPQIGHITSRDRNILQDSRVKHHAAYRKIPACVHAHCRAGTKQQQRVSPQVVAGMIHRKRHFAFGTQQYAEYSGAEVPIAECRRFRKVGFQHEKSFRSLRFRCQGNVTDQLVKRERFGNLRTIRLVHGSESIFKSISFRTYSIVCRPFSVAAPLKTVKSTRIASPRSSFCAI